MPTADVVPAQPPRAVRHVDARRALRVGHRPLPARRVHAAQGPAAHAGAGGLARRVRAPRAARALRERPAAHRRRLGQLRRHGGRRRRPGGGGGQRQLGRPVSRRPARALARPRRRRARARDPGRPPRASRGSPSMPTPRSTSSTSSSPTRRGSPRPGAPADAARCRSGWTTRTSRATRGAGSSATSATPSRRAPADVALGRGARPPGGARRSGRTRPWSSSPTTARARSSPTWGGTPPTHNVEEVLRVPFFLKAAGQVEGDGRRRRRQPDRPAPHADRPARHRDRLDLRGPLAARRQRADARADRRAGRRGPVRRRAPPRGRLPATAGTGRRSPPSGRRPARRRWSGHPLDDLDVGAPSELGWTPDQRGGVRVPPEREAGGAAAGHRRDHGHQRAARRCCSWSTARWPG